MDIEAIVTEAVRSNASDIHFQENRPARVRQGITLERAGYTPTSRQQLLDWLGSCGLDIGGRPDQLDDMGTAFSLTETIRCRVHAFWEHSGLHVAVRILYPLSSINQDPDEGLLDDLSRLMDGLVIVTGATGSGKTTTLWRIINYLNERRHCHIVTLEDPIEYILEGKASLISQREYQVHFSSYSEGVKQALRQDPDVLLIGEMRDTPTMEAALTAAETGHLVFSTLHTRSAAQAITRFVGAFPSDKGSDIRTRLAQTLQAVLSQRRYVDDGGRTKIVREVLMRTTAVEQLIRSGREFQLETIMQTGASHGMRTMAQALAAQGITE
jgi:twitching motility protein PilT